MNGRFGWHGLEGKALREATLSPATLKRQVEKLGGTVENDTCGRWNVRQLIAPTGKLWPEGIRMIRVEWPKGESPIPACRDAFSRISGQLRDIKPEDLAFYAED